ncbi:MAG: EscU/YscU/HrcU family type III secretion system export apparatus switch protein [Chloroflexota bacterium]
MADQTAEKGDAYRQGAAGEGVVTPARRKAVALRYDPAVASAPKVVASGSGLVAEEILKLARQHNVPVKDDPLLVQALMKLEIGETIHPQLYRMVAEVFAWLFRLDREEAERSKPGV